MHLLVHREISFIIVLAALGMADHHILDAQLLQHLRGHLTGVGAVGLIVAVLRADGDAALFEQAHGGLDIHIGHAQHYLAPVGLAQQGLKLLGKCTGFGEGFVHFPVSSDNRLTVAAVHGKQSFRFWNSYKGAARPQRSGSCGATAEELPGTEVVTLRRRRGRRTAHPSAKNTLHLRRNCFFVCGLRCAAAPLVSAILSYLSSRHATPGSSLPSRNSREAPPPVEMWVILSA